MVGRIILVQEGRFRLLLDDGRARLFTLGVGAALEPQDLIGLQRRQARVSIRTHAAAGLLSEVADRITEI